MDRQNKISDLLSQLRAAHPAGFAIALHVEFSAPRYLFQAYASDWIDLYTREGLVLRDPTVRWGFVNTGAIRWSALDDPEGAEVMRLAAEHGLRYGFTLAIEAGGSRSIASFARPDRESTDAEIAEATGVLTQLHDLTRGVETLTPRFHDALKQMSIYLTRD
jgi:LuxR family transcriptional regulator